MSLLDNSFPQIELEYDWGYIPTKAECIVLWDKYGMLSNIREHSLLVADFALALAKKINEKFPNTLNEDFVYAAGLIHDIAKTWTIRNGGSHQQIGSSIVRSEFDNPLLSSCVYHHVVWPWQEGILSLKNMIFHAPIMITYSDKRVRHNELVSLDERFADLQNRYGKTEEIRQNIELNYQQAKQIENYLAQKMDFNLHACTLISGSLVS